MKLTVAFRNFANTPKNRLIYTGSQLRFVVKIKRNTKRGVCQRYRRRCMNQAVVFCPASHAYSTKWVKAIFLLWVKLPECEASRSYPLIRQRNKKPSERSTPCVSHISLHLHAVPLNTDSHPSPHLRQEFLILYCSLHHLLTYLLHGAEFFLRS
jgi:hypothetical protein